MSPQPDGSSTIIKICGIRLAEIAQVAIEKEMGARALRTTMEDLLLDLMYELPSTREVKEVVITKEAVDNTGEPIKVLDKKAS